MLRKCGDDHCSRTTAFEATLLKPACHIKLVRRYVTGHYRTITGVQLPGHPKPALVHDAAPLFGHYRVNRAVPKPLSNQSKKSAKRTDIKSILILGAGPIVIVSVWMTTLARKRKALREGGSRHFRELQPAIRSIQMADAIHIEPIHWHARLFGVERPTRCCQTM